MKHLTTIAALVVMSAKATLHALPEPDFAANFDGNTIGKLASGDSATPFVEENIHYVDGIRGQAIFVPSGLDGKKSLLGYETEKLFKSKSGTVMFWFRPNWKGDSYGDIRFPHYNLFYAEESSADASERLQIFLWNQLRADVFRGLAETPISLHQGNQYSFTMGQQDWFHVALVWNDDGYLKFYLNGLPYNHADGARSWNLYPVAALANLYGVDQFFVGSKPGSGSSKLGADAAFDELKIFRKALDGSAIAAEYRSDCPLTLRLDQRYYVADHPCTLSLEVYPVGIMENPSMAPPESQVTEAKFEFTLYAYPTDKALTKWNQNLSVDSPKAIDLELPSLDEGIYFLRCETRANGAKHQRSFILNIYTPQPPAQASDMPIDVGEPFVIIDATKDEYAFGEIHASEVVSSEALGRYRETGEDNHSSVFFEFDVPGPYQNGQPMVIDFYWPDDRARSFGLYVYPENEARPHHRDRLMGGIQSGSEYPLSGKIQHARYLFFPWTKRHLFEMRCLADGKPGALSRIEISPVVGRLPKLAINKPATQSGRSFGVFDEDQTFEIIFNFDRDRFKPLHLPRMLDQVLDYLDYVGQDTLSFQLIRYDYIRYDIPGAIQSIHNLRSAPGFMPLMLDLFAARDKKILGGIDLYTLPESSLDPENNGQRKRDGYYQIDDEGKIIKPRVGYGRPNLFHPDAQQSFFRHVTEILRRYGNHNGFDGLNLWATSIFWSPEGGFSDYTIDLFQRETGIVIPASSEDSRYAQRKAYLLGEQREAWLTWRTQKVAYLLAGLSHGMQAINPELKLYLSFTGIERLFPQGWENSLNSNNYEETMRLIGFDPNLLKDIPNLVLMPVRDPNMNRWQQHRTGASTNLDALFASDKEFTFFRDLKTPIASASYFRYFESYQKPIRNDQFGSYFQCADAKAHGKYYLKELTESVVNLDPQSILIGGQPFATLGRDSESREFARAFGALPAIPFSDIPGTTDPVIGRYAIAGDTTWLYLINRTWQELEVSLSASGASEMTNLSDRKSLPAQNGSFAITLQPYQLQSFKLNGVNKALRLATQPSQALATFYQQRFEALSEIAEFARTQGKSIKTEDRFLEGIQAALNEGGYAEAHRLLFSLPMLQLEAQRSALESGHIARQSEMIAKGHIAIDLGSTEFFDTDNGTLFFPDQAYQPGTYGFIGPDKTVVRQIGDMEATENPLLFKTERWMMQNYRIDLPPGNYLIRTYQKIGYEPNRAPGKVVFGINAEDKVLAPVEDLFEKLGEDGNRVLIREYPDLAVNDGSLNLNFVHPDSTDPSVPFLNAIEIIPLTNES